MNGPIINPMIFYWLHVIDIVHYFIAALCIVSTGATIGLLLCWISDEPIPDIKKYMKRPVIVMIITAMIWIFMPSKDTLIEMIIAKMATYENAQWTLGTIKEAVNYVIEAFKTIH